MAATAPRLHNPAPRLTRCTWNTWECNRLSRARRRGSFYSRRAFGGLRDGGWPVMETFQMCITDHAQPPSPLRVDCGPRAMAGFAVAHVKPRDCVPRPYAMKEGFQPTYVAQTARSASNGFRFEPTCPYSVWIACLKAAIQPSASACLSSASVAKVRVKLRNP